MTTHSSRVDAALARLRASGERVTVARRCVLTTLAATDEHLDAEQIAARVAATSPGVHRATVYRVLASLGELGLVSHTHLGGSATVYHLAVAPTGQEAGPTVHAHLRCTSCGVVMDVPAAVLDPLARRLLADHDFDLAAHHAALLGTCAACRTR